MTVPTSDFTCLVRYRAPPHGFRLSVGTVQLFLTRRRIGGEMYRKRTDVCRGDASRNSRATAARSRSHTPIASFLPLSQQLRSEAMTLRVCILVTSSSTGRPKELSSQSRVSANRTTSTTRKEGLVRSLSVACCVSY
eukprot:48071-Rhodomonas_salina.3